MEGDVVLLPNAHAVPGGQLFVLDRYVAFEDEDVKTVSFPAHGVFIGIFLQVQGVEPGRLMNPSRMLGTIAFGSHDRAQLIGACRSERDLLVTGRKSASIREYPYLEEFDGTVGAVLNSLWMIPVPAVITWISPVRSTEVCPMLS